MVLIEGFLAYPVTQLQGAEQLLIVGFMIIFPFFVASLFFYVVWHRPIHLYRPAEITPGLEDRYQTQEAKVGLDEDRLESFLEEQIRRVPLEEGVARKISHVIQEAYLTVDPSPLLGASTSPWQAPYAQFDTVQELLNTVYASLHDVRPFSYAQEWILQDANSGRLITDIGTGSKFCKLSGKFGDDRKLQEVGILPGMRLLVSSPKERVSSRRSRPVAPELIVCTECEKQGKIPWVRTGAKSRRTHLREEHPNIHVPKWNDDIVGKFFRTAR